ncbi:MAG: CidA/LrgA family protein [Gammaproteobacteria bacterium]|nr:CidA/LrgA family protein [Gammaproteobacteria bacterium]MBQ0839116.1 CidA/LrgA family protein [Gammaproteobacteria bacterium]
MSSALDYLKGLAVLLLFQLLGEGLAQLLPIAVPGPVLGMLLLFFTLRQIGPPVWLVKTAGRLISLLSLFFIPAGLGIFFLPASIQQQWPAILAAIVGGTLLSIALTGLTLKALTRGLAEE